MTTTTMTMMSPILRLLMNTLDVRGLEFSRTRGEVHVGSDGRYIGVDIY